MTDVQTIECEVCNLTVGTSTERIKYLCRHPGRSYRLNDNVYQCGKSKKYPDSVASFCSKEHMNIFHKDLKVMVKKQ